MPELPEVEALARFLDQAATGQRVVRAEAAGFYSLKTYDPPLSALLGEEVKGAGRRGKYLLLAAGELWLVAHLARAGWLRWWDSLPEARAPRGKSPLALRVGLSSGAGFDVTEQGSEKRLAVWIVRAPEEVEGLARLGPDPLDPSLDAQALGRLLTRRGGTLKNALADQTVIAGVGNAYSDEVLHAARLSPFKPANRLTDGEVATLHAALRRVLLGALERSAGLGAAALKAEKRSGLLVHGRAGKPCPVCGDTIREVSFETKSLQYCPTCQTGGRPLADRRLSRLLK